MTRQSRQASSSGVESPASDREEEGRDGECVGLRAGGECGSRFVQIARDPVGRLLAERDDAILAALAAANVHVLLLEVYVAEIETDSLGAAQAGRVDELDERAVPEREWALALERCKLLFDFGTAWRIGEPTASPRRQPRVRHTRGAERVPQKRAHCRELS